MRLRNDVDLITFLNEVKTCEGNVWFESAGGDKLNLKSVLSQYLFASLSGNMKLLYEGEIVCDKENAYSALNSYLTAAKK